MYDLVVIGGGSGGLTAASLAAKAGAKVALIEKEKLGGECRNVACVPSKALLRAARIAQDARSAGDFGIKLGEVEVDFPAVMARVRAVVVNFQETGGADPLREKGIDIFFGSARFEAYNSVKVDDRDRIEGSRFLIATGSRPKVPEVPGLAESGYLDNRTVWGLEERPESLAILGSGPVGLEFAQAFNRLGTPVTVLEKHEHILAREDPDATTVLRERLEAEGITFYRDVEVTGIGARDGKPLIKFRSRPEGRTFEALRSHLLVSTGRTANFEGLDLEAAGISDATDCGIPVNDYLATENHHIYAIGDVTGRDLYTHAAEREAAIAVHNALRTIPKKFRRDAVPRCLFTDPEFAAVGMTEADALLTHPDARVYRVDLALVDRVRIDGGTGGLAKVVATASGKILGAVIVGPEASLAINEFSLAIEHGLTLEDLNALIRPYPTVASALRSLSGKFAAERTDRGFVRSALGWFSGFESGRG